MKPVCNSVSVRVPATSANLGSGFDTAGIALDYADSLVFTLDDNHSKNSLHLHTYTSTAQKSNPSTNIL
ncbi:homoserine kinase [Chlamydia trachomatis]|nr:homoserine kinase [Chlamydia trachomatis]